MGKLQRNKGKEFERKVARWLREKYPDATVRRTVQSYEAWNSDVVIEGAVPEVARALWIECENAKEPSYRAKMKQAERDVAKAKDEGRLVDPFYRLPVVFWHELHRKHFWVTLRLGDLAYIRGEADLDHRYDSRGAETLVTMEMKHFIEMLPD